MAIDTVNEKLAVMEWCQVWEPGLPISPGAIGQDDQQQLLWGYPGVLWGEAAAVVASDRRRPGILGLAGRYAKPHQPGSFAYTHRR